MRQERFAVRRRCKRCPNHAGANERGQSLRAMSRRLKGARRQHATARAVEPPPMIGALDGAVADRAPRKRHVAVRTPVYENGRSVRTLKCYDGRAHKPSRNRLAAQLLDARDRKPSLCNGVRIRGHNPRSCIKGTATVLSTRSMALTTERRATDKCFV